MFKLTIFHLFGVGAVCLGVVAAVAVSAWYVDRVTNRARPVPRSLNR